MQLQAGQKTALLLEADPLIQNRFLLKTLRHCVIISSLLSLESVTLEWFATRCQVNCHGFLIFHSEWLQLDVPQNAGFECSQHLTSINLLQLLWQQSLQSSRSWEGLNGVCCEMPDRKNASVNATNHRKTANQIHFFFSVCACVLDLFWAWEFVHQKKNSLHAFW